MLPKITIITPSFNQGHFIEETIESVLSQNYPNLEYIIMDGGSTDNTVEVIKKYEKHISHWESVKDKGQSDAIQKGLNIATGYVINWLNSDDYYTPGTLNKVGELFSNLNTRVVAGKSRIFGEGYIDRFSQGTDIYPNNLSKTIGWARIDQPETFFRLEDWKTIGGVNQNFHYVMDKELWIRYLLLNGLDGIIQLDDILVNFRLHGDSKTVSLQQKFEEEESALFIEMAMIFGLENQFSILKSNKSIPLFDFYNSVNKEIITKSLHYYLLHKADVAYYFNDVENCNKYLSAIDVNYIQNDVNLFNKLKSRNRIPVWLRKLLR